ncbi:MAG: DNA repair protein RadA [Marinilabiliales bacterium]
MAKTKTVYVCSECGYESAKWIGRCNSCGEWNTFKELKLETKKNIRTVANYNNKPIPVKDINIIDYKRITTPFNELNRVLGGGIVIGSVILIGGDPGIGKSTLMLQTAINLPLKVLYVSGEESERQIKMRAERLGINNEECYIYTETSLDNVFRTIEEIKPTLVIIDSIQTVFLENNEAPVGSITQVRESATAIMNYAKKNNIPFFIVGHINKDGNIAGPKILEHIVDVVLQFEGDQNFIYRIIRSAKNRFGSATETGVFEMSEKGLNEITNPSEYFLANRSKSLSGIAVASSIEGMRPFLIEIQALVSSAVYGTPQRSTTGFDYKRMNMLLAVLEKKAGFKLISKDVFLNVTGGLKIKDTGVDLAVICAILSADQDIAIPEDCCFAGEVGLSGEVRPVTRILQRINEAEKLGFKIIFISDKNKQNINLNDYSIKIVFVNKVEEVFEKIFG